MRYETLFQRALYPAYNRLIGRDYPAFLRAAEETQFQSTDEIRERQWSRVKAQLEQAYANVPFYARRWREDGVTPADVRSWDDFRLLPTISKADLRAHTDELIARGVDRRTLSFHRTGGSTGEPLVFYTDKTTDAASAADFYRALRWWGADAGVRTVMFWGSPRFLVRNSRDRLGVRVLAVQHWLMNRLFFPNYDLSPETMRRYYHQIRRFRPQVVRGMASSLYVFSKFLRDNNLSLAGTGIRAVLSQCEYLYDWERQEIEAALGAPVVNTYGLSEFGEVAFQYRCGHMHLMDESVHAELLPAPSEGEGREIVVTHLHNRSTPLIRYRTGDIADAIDGACTCGLGLRRLHGLKGRAHDFIVRSDGGVVHGQFFTHVLVFQTGVQKYQVIQEDVDSFRVKLVVAPDAPRRTIENELRSAVRTHVGEDATVAFEYVPSIPVEASGKYRWIVSRVGTRSREAASVAPQNAG